MTREVHRKLSSAITENTDLRVQRTTREIKRALLTLIARKTYREITVKSIIEEALVTRRTFYRHFSSKADVLDAIEKDFIDDLDEKLKAVHPGNYGGGVRVFYEFLNTDDKAKSKLFFDEEYEMFSRKLTYDFFSLGFFKRMVRKEYRRLLPGYLGSATAIFKEWKEEPENKNKATLDELTERTCNLLTNGINSI